MTEAAIEAEIQAKGLNAPRLTPEFIDSLILSETYTQASTIWPDAVSITGITPGGQADCRSPEVIRALSCLTICVLTLRNGFTVVGHSACVSPENFNAEIGRKIARENARAQIWALEGYALRSSLADGAVPTSAITGTG